MKTLIWLILAFPLAGFGAIPEGFADRMADAIYKAEGGDKTRFPYGVKSVKVKDRQEARKVTINSVRNNWKRWERAGKPGKFVDFMADRWCPVSVDPVGNENWKSNVRKLLKNS